MKRFREKSGRPARGSRAGFSLIELLIVITILAVLAALLMPGIEATWEVAYMTHCKSNLHTLWEAQGLWRADHDGRLLEGAAWMGRLLPYVDWRTDVFQCQTRADWGYSARESDDFAPPKVVEGEVLIEDSSSSETPGSEWEPANDEIDACFEFDVYFQRGSEGNIWSGGSNSGVRGEFVYSIPLGSVTWAQRSEGNGFTNYKIDDERPENRSGNYDDLEVNVFYENGQPSKAQLLTPRGSGAGGSVDRRFIFDFKVCGEVVLTDVAGQEVGGTPKWGQTIELGADGAGGGSEGPRWTWDGAHWVRKTTEVVPLLFGDYALSRGTYERADGSSVPTVDGRLFYILDYGARKTVADFNHGGTDEDEWTKYFITDIDWWRAAYRTEAKDWRAYQALRHFGRANVLFCDGHIEALGPEDLHYSNPLWAYQGR
jgi:prepilin-type N-terminal cleavage/methylation domain-containing protein/prepilin-type processing-associated H-X9-DG protein